MSLTIIPGLACTWLLETHQETGAWAEPACRRLCNTWQPCPLRSPSPSVWPKAALLSVSWPSGLGLQVAQCVIWALALPALLLSAAFSLWLLGDAPGRDGLEP